MFSTIYEITLGVLPASPIDLELKSKTMLMERLISCLSCTCIIVGYLLINLYSMHGKIGKQRRMLKSVNEPSSELQQQLRLDYLTGITIIVAYLAKTARFTGISSKGLPNLISEQLEYSMLLCTVIASNQEAVG